LPGETDPYGMREKPDWELEGLALSDRASRDPNLIGAARAELARRRREHAAALVNKQLEAANRQLAAAKSVRWATILAAIAAVASALSAIFQTLMAWWHYT
jgi:hypothetical protein